MKKNKNQTFGFLQMVTELANILSPYYFHY